MVCIKVKMLSHTLVRKFSSSSNTVHSFFFFFLPGEEREQGDRVKLKWNGQKRFLENLSFPEAPGKVFVAKRLPNN